MHLHVIQTIDADRAKQWHVGMDPWSLADWGNAMAGEVGEACNVIKKIRREQTGRKGTGDKPMLELKKQLGEELADALLYLVLVAEAAGIDIEEAVRDKFNAVSEREGFTHRL